MFIFVIVNQSVGLKVIQAAGHGGPENGAPGLWANAIITNAQLLIRSAPEVRGCVEIPFSSDTSELRYVFE